VPHLSVDAGFESGPWERKEIKEKMMSPTHSRGRKGKGREWGGWTQGWASTWWARLAKRENR